jgi:hypothetical protein
MTRFREGQRLATVEERTWLNANRGSCWIVREYGDKSVSCPNPRVDGGATCEWHARYDTERKATVQVTA